MSNTNQFSDTLTTSTSIRPNSSIFYTLLTVLFLSGCAGNPSISVKEVYVEVPVPCKIEKPEKPVFPLQEANKDEDNIYVIIQKALAEIELRKGYEVKLEAAIDQCNYSKPTNS